MTIVLLYLFWAGFAVLFYCYIGYGILVFLINKVRLFVDSNRKPFLKKEVLPVTIIICSYNEGAILREKIVNTLSLDYPAGKLKIILALEGNTNDPKQIADEFPSVSIIHQSERKGKYAALKAALTYVDTPITIFSDANTMINSGAIKKMMNHFADKRVGGVAGEKKIASSTKENAVGGAEGLYWRYESIMKKLDAGFYTVVGAAGELFAIRTSLFRIPANEIILDDFIVSMNVCLQGFKITYEPGAYATELPSASLAEETKRKVRISAGAYQSIGYLKDALNFIRHPLLCFQYISRRLFRWIFCPLLLFILFFLNLFICIDEQAGPLYKWLFLGQVIFYILSLAGWLLVRNGKSWSILMVPFYFVFMNYCLIRGFIKFLRGQQTVYWEKSLRQAVG